jgi:hypothetical protein
VKKDRDDQDVSAAQIEPKSESEFNPAGAARRRLLRALTASGGAIAGGLLAPKWTKPVINAAILPAHAQATMVVAPACPISASVAIVPSSSVPYTAVILASDTNAVSTTLASSVIGGESTIVTGEISTLLPGSYSALFFVQFASSVNWASTFTASCCSDFRSFAGTDTATFAAFQQAIILNDDGSCSVP